MIPHDSDLELHAKSESFRRGWVAGFYIGELRWRYGIRSTSRDAGWPRSVLDYLRGYFVGSCYRRRTRSGELALSGAGSYGRSA